MATVSDFRDTRDRSRLDGESKRFVHDLLGVLNLRSSSIHTRGGSTTLRGARRRRLRVKAAEEEKGFEPLVGCPTADFKSAALDHSATPPERPGSYPKGHAAATATRQRPR